MKDTFILCTSLFLFVAASPDFTVFENDVVLNPDAIGGLNIDGAFTIDIIPSKTPKIEINLRENNTKVEYAYYQNTTHIRMPAKWLSFLQKNNARDRRIIKIYTPTITDLTIAGASDVSIGYYSQGSIETLRLDISGANDIVFKDIVAKRILATFSGSSDIRVPVINSTSFNVEMSGSGTLHVDMLASEHVVLEHSGSTNLNIEAILLKTLDITTSGSSAVRISEGAAGEATFNTSGSSAITIPRVQINDVNVTSRGSSDIRIHVIDTLYVDARGSSTISYTGKPSQIKSSIGGSAKLLPR